MMSRSCILHVLLLFLSTPLFAVQGYVNYKTYLPEKIQLKWLSKMTGDICQSPIGSHLFQEAPQVLKGWSESKSVSAENAVAVELLVKRLVQENNPQCQPTTVDHYNIILSLWAKSGEGVFAAERCEQILTTMQQAYEKGNNPNVQPNLVSFKAVLLAWKHSGVSFNTHRSQRILEWMIQLYKKGQNDELLLPDSNCFDIVLQIWSRSDDPKAASRCEQLLVAMEQLAKATQSPKLKPTTYSFNAVLGAWAKVTQTSQDCTRLVSILSFMEHVSTSSNDDDNKRAEPDRASYSIVLCALARSMDPKAATHADSLLRSVVNQYKSGTLSWEPDTILFNAVIGCWAHASHDPLAYRKARSVLDRQFYLYYTLQCQACKPDVIGFTSVLSSCASTDGPATERKKAFDVALATFSQLENTDGALFGTPNHVTYGTMLKACARLLPHQSKEQQQLRSKWTHYFWNKCVAKGMVGGMVLSRVREAATPSEYKELLQGHSKKSPPDSWTCNVHETNEYRRNPSSKNRKKTKRATV